MKAITVLPPERLLADGEVEIAQTQHLQARRRSRAARVSRRSGTPSPKRVSSPRSATIGFCSWGELGTYPETHSEVFRRSERTLALSAWQKPARIRLCGLPMQISRFTAGTVGKLCRAFCSA